MEAFNPFDPIMLMRYCRKERNLNMFLCCPSFNLIGKKNSSSDRMIFKRLPVFLRANNRNFSRCLTT